MTIIDKIKDRGFSPAQVAILIGISESHLYSINKGRVSPSVDTALKLCIMLDICPFALFEFNWPGECPLDSVRNQTALIEDDQIE